MKAAQAEARRIAAIQRDTIAALTLAMPPALATQFGSLGRCTEASVVGARVLRDAGIPARAVPCAVLARCDELELGTVAGYTRAELAALAGRDVMAEGEVNESSFHIVIEAQPAMGRTIIDLTAGQLIGDAQTLVMPEESGWPAVEFGAWCLRYDAAPRADSAETHITRASSMPYKGLTEDVVELMTLAKLCRCDKETFYTALLKHDRELTMRFLAVAERSGAAAARMQERHADAGAPGS